MKSQSLWNRAGSFDVIGDGTSWLKRVSIPLEQGGVFRLGLAFASGALGGLNPFGTGRGLSTIKWFAIHIVAQSQSLWNRAGSFDPTLLLWLESLNSLNPFGTGRGLSTRTSWHRWRVGLVSIPLEQGGVFRLQGWFGALMDKSWEDRFPIFSLTRKVRYEFD